MRNVLSSITVEQASWKTGVPVSQIKKMIANRKIFGMRLDDVTLVSPAAIPEIIRLAEEARQAAEAEERPNPFYERAVQLGPGSARFGEPGFEAVHARSVDDVGAVRVREVM